VNTLTVTVFPISVGGLLPGVAYTTSTWRSGVVTTGEWPGTGPRKSTDPKAWFAFVKRRMKLPLPVKMHGLGWMDGIHPPDSENPSCAISGIILTWRLL